MDRLYPALLDAHLGDDFAILDQSLDPRPPEMFLNLAGQTGLDQGMLAIDVGCGRGVYAAQLARRHGCQVVGLDLALGNLRLALTYQQSEPDLMAYYSQADIEALPVSDGAADLVLSRDMLLHVSNLERGLAECARALRPGGNMIVLATVAGRHLSEQEATELFEPLGVVARNLSDGRLRAAFSQAGLAIQQVEGIGGERLEHLEESYGFYSCELMRLARMRRAPDHYRRELGPERYRMAVALYTLSIYLLIGKLIDVIYVLEK